MLSLQWCKQKERNKYIFPIYKISKNIDELKVDERVIVNIYINLREKSEMVYVESLKIDTNLEGFETFMRNLLQIYKHNSILFYKVVDNIINILISFTEQNYHSEIVTSYIDESRLMSEIEYEVRIDAGEEKIESFIKGIAIDKEKLINLLKSLNIKTAYFATKAKRKQIKKVYEIMFDYILKVANSRPFRFFVINHAHYFEVKNIYFLSAAKNKVILSLDVLINPYIDISYPFIVTKLLDKYYDFSKKLDENILDYTAKQIPDIEKSKVTKIVLEILSRALTKEVLKNWIKSAVDYTFNAVRTEKVDLEEDLQQDFRWIHKVIARLNKDGRLFYKKEKSRDVGHNVMHYITEKLVEKLKDIGLKLDLDYKPIQEKTFDNITISTEDRGNLGYTIKIKWKQFEALHIFISKRRQTFDASWYFPFKYEESEELINDIFDFIEIKKQEKEFIMRLMRIDGLLPLFMPG